MVRALIPLCFHLCYFGVPEFTLPHKIYTYVYVATCEPLASVSRADGRVAKTSCKVPPDIEKCCYTKIYESPKKLYVLPSVPYRDGACNHSSKLHTLILLMSFHIAILYHLLAITLGKVVSKRK